MQESTSSEQAQTSERRCSRCKTWLPLSQFRQRPARNNNYASWCRTCQNAHALKKYHADPSKREKKLMANLKRMYDISLDEYTTLLETQGGVCAICKKPEEKIDSRTAERDASTAALLQALRSERQM